MILQSVSLCIQSLLSCSDSSNSDQKEMASPLSDEFDPSFVQVENKFFITMKRHASSLQASPSPLDIESDHESIVESINEQSPTLSTLFTIKKEQGVVGTPVQVQSEFDTTLKNCRDLSVYLNCLHVFLHRSILDSDLISDRVSMNLLQELATGMLDIFMLPLIKESKGSLNDLNSFTESNLEELEQSKDTLSIHSLKIISSLVRFGIFYTFIEYNGSFRTTLIHIHSRICLYTLF